MGWSDPQIITQMEEAARNPPSPYERAFASVTARCDEMEQSPLVEMQMCAKITRGLAVHVLEMERVGANGELGRSAEMFGGILLGISACLSMLFDTGNRATNKAIKADFLQMLDDAIKERARSRRGAKTCRT